MQRTNSPERRAAAMFVGLTLGLITLICAAFGLLGVTIPESAVIIGRWLPALASLLVIRLVGLPGGVATWWGLRPRGWKRLLVGCAVGIATLVLVYLAAALLVGLTGQVQPQPWSDLAPVAIWLLPYALLFSLSTLGEEAGWRGFLQRLLGDQGFWRTALTISVVWVLFHVPLHGVMVLQGTLPVQVALASTASLLPLGLLLSALVTRFGSVWPAVLAHAMPISALNLVVGAGELSAGALWLLTGVTAALLVLATVLLRPQAGSASS